MKPTTAAAAAAKEIYKVAEVAVMFGVTPKVVRGLIHQKKLRARWTGAQWLVPASAVAEYLAGADDPNLATAS